MLVDGTIRPLVTQWASRSNPEWSAAETNRVCEELQSLSGVVTPHIVPNADISNDDIQRYLLMRVRSAVENWLSMAAARVRYSLQIKPPKMRKDGERAIGLRSATHEELEGLTGIGDERAKDIARMLELHPTITSISQLDAIEGIGPATVAHLYEESYLDKPLICLASPTLLSFANHSNIENFLTLLDNSDLEITFGDGSSFASHPPGGGNTAERFLSLITSVQLKAEHRLSPASGTTSQDIKDYLFRQNLRQKYLDKLKPADGSLLINAAYAPAAVDILNSATNSIRLMMFLGTASADNDEGPGPLPLVEALEAQAAAGIQVRVILDRDEADDPYHSEDINKHLVKRLKQAGIDVRYDTRQTLLHSKFLVVDDSRTISGSHNMTRSSFTKTWEVSAHIDSQSLATSFAKRFDTLWDSLN